MDHLDDDNQRLLQSANSGDDDALATLLERVRPMLRAEAMKSLTEARARLDPSDVVQLTWWSAFRGFPRFEGNVDAFIGWIRKIHDRNLKDAIRDQLAARRDLRREHGEVRMGDVVDGRTTTPSKRLARNEELERLERCLVLLPAAQREAVRLRFYEGFAVSDIVRQMGRSETAVAGLIKRGLSRLRQLLAEQSRSS
jgi:RNA polymerase sigma-70 factor (ECF subfamily)